MEHTIQNLNFSNTDFLGTFLKHAVDLRIAAEGAQNTLFGIDMSIEGLRSQNFSYGIFVFLILSLILFSVIIYFYIPKKKNDSLKAGEKVMFGAIIFGMFLAIAIGWVQLVEGYLI